MIRSIVVDSHYNGHVILNLIDSHWNKQNINSTKIEGCIWVLVSARKKAYKRMGRGSPKTQFITLLKGETPKQLQAFGLVPTFWGTFTPCYWELTNSEFKFFGMWKTLRRFVMYCVRNTLLSVIRRTHEEAFQKMKSSHFWAFRVLKCLTPWLTFPSVTVVIGITGIGLAFSHTSYWICSWIGIVVTGSKT